MKIRLAATGWWTLSCLCCAPAPAQDQAARFPEAAIRELGRKYLELEAPEESSGPEADRWTGGLFQEIGRRIEEQGAGSVPAEDVALAAWAYARRTAGQPAVPPGGKRTGKDSPAPARPPDPGDILKGDEGLRQGIEAMASRPVIERLAISGDITAGVQAATVPANTDLTSAFGRVRLNFLLEAVPRSPDGAFSAGYFFLQLRAAGGPLDTSAVGGPVSFTPLNDVARDRSRFNEGISRGNIYFSRAYYQQSLRVRGGEIRGRAGIINLTDFFDTNLFANNDARQFLNSAFSNGAAFETGITAPGVMAEYERGPWLLKPGWLNGITLRGGYALSRTERAFSSPLWAGELALRTSLRGRNGNWRVGGTAGNVAGAGSVSTVHVSVDQWLTGRAGIFGRVGVSNAGEAARTFGPVRWAYSGGLQWRFVNQSDNASAWSIGFSQAFPAIRSGNPVSERVLETYYRWQITRNAALSPSFQLVKGAGGQVNRDLHTVYGVRLFFGY